MKQIEIYASVVEDETIQSEEKSELQRPVILKIESKQEKDKVDIEIQKKRIEVLKKKEDLLNKMEKDLDG